ncbi:restriction endonuclease subunit S [Priestia flexa]|uniref:restriction endonuclease subunit S n=1 Tax=Priestia flexa TaxID=86664 RepID=UPI0020A179E8|nr:restriction endonuclease subunit S [Priestia flexa]MCP1188029.1 restriction endonuclease subunit S [Priestia flexa]
MEIKLIDYSSLTNTERWEPNFHLQQTNLGEYEETRVLESLCQIVPSNRKVSNVEIKNYDKYIDGSCIDKFTGGIKNSKKINDKVSRRLRYCTEGGDMLIPLVEAESSLPTVLPKNELFLVSDIFAVCVPKIDPNYIYWAFTTEYVKTQIKALSKGTVVKRLSLRDLKQISIPWMKEEQRKEKIQTIKLQLNDLDTEDSQSTSRLINNIIKNYINIDTTKNEEKKLFSVGYQALSGDTWTPSGFNPLMDDFINELTRQAKSILPLDQVGRVDIGFNPSKHKADGSNKIGLIKAKNIKVQKINLEIEETVEVDNIPEEKILVKGDILFRVKGSIGPAAIVDEEANGYLFHDHLVRIQPKTEIVIPEYLSIILNSDLVEQQTKRYETSSSMRYISIKDLKSILIPIVDISIQRTIVEELTK